MSHRKKEWLVFSCTCVQSLIDPVTDLYILCTPLPLPVENCHKIPFSRFVGTERITADVSRIFCINHGILAILIKRHSVDIPVAHDEGHVLFVPRGAAGDMVHTEEFLHRPHRNN